MLSKPLLNVKNFIHMIALCFNLILQMLTVLVMVFHVYALIGMSMYNINFNMYLPTTKYETCRLA